MPARDRTTTRWRRLAGATVAALIAVPLSWISSTTAAHAAPAPPAGFSPVWSDDFNGAAGSGLNTNDWLYDTGHGYPGGATNWGTGEIESYSSSTANVYQDGSGHLVIKPIRDGAGNWTSGRVETQRTDFAAPVGGVLHVEASIQQPNVSSANGAGYWPAFWMLGAAHRAAAATNWPGPGELDILENVNSSSSYYQTMHCGTSSGGPCNETTGIGSGQRACNGCGTAFHTYGVEIDRSMNPEQVRFYFDGANTFTINANQMDATTWANAVDHGFFILLNVAIGGGWPGMPNGSTASGVPMLVDYVSVSQKTSGSARVPLSNITGPGGKCIDVAGDDTGGNGTAVQLWDCQSTSRDQHWTFVNGTLQSLNRCLDVVNNGTANYSQLQIWDCTGGPNQQWVTRSDGSLLNPVSGRCVDSPGGATANGTRLQVYDCNSSAAQLYAVHDIITGPGGKCVDVAGDDTGGNGTAVQLWDCQSTSVDQRWTLTNGTLRSLNRCLDIVNNGTANFSQLQIWDCGGGPNQQWLLRSNGTLYNPQSGRCVDSPGGATANGTRLQIYDCNTSAAQNWTMR